MFTRIKKALVDHFSLYEVKSIAYTFGAMLMGDIAFSGGLSKFLEGPLNKEALLLFGTMFIRSAMKVVVAMVVAALKKPRPVAGLEGV